jgi:hypothetical protein
MTLARRLTWVLLAVAMLAANATLCEGWVGSAETRMACCRDGSCPMHKRKERDPSSRRVSQAEADACCASQSSRETSQTGRSLPVPSLSDLGPGVVVPETPPTVVCGRRAAALVPVSISPPPRHLLLSVFLI